jgi:hypothetical protein
MSQGLRDRIWITAHVRMRTERRLRSVSKTLNFVTVWYSTILTCLTVYQLVAEKDMLRDVASAALAIAVLALSIFIPSLNLDQQADRFRECYLKLQRLLDTVSDEDMLKSQYFDVLDAYPNHPPTDHIDFVVASDRSGKEVTNAGETVKITRSMKADYWFRKVRGISFALAGYAAPALLYFIL